MNRLPVALLLALGIASPAWSQTAIQPGTITGTFDAQGYGRDYETIFTVPAGKNARVTDVMIINYSDSRCSMEMLFGGAVRYFQIADRQTVILPLNTGFGMVAGQTARGFTGCTSNALYVHLRGFYFTIP